jgi:hypothetical protein
MFMLDMLPLPILLPPLPFILLRPSRNLPAPIHLRIHSRHEPRRLAKQILHLLEGQLLGFGQERPEEQRVGEVGDAEEDIESPAHVLHPDAGDLADHGVEGEGRHGCDRDAFCAGGGVEDLGGDDPCYLQTPS